MACVIRKKIRISGTVQGVGFRPFVFQLAKRFSIGGFILNDSHGVALEIEGDETVLATFCRDLHHGLPPLASISSWQEEVSHPEGDAEFVIRASESQSERSAQVAADTFVCRDCLQELFSPADRRFRYPFINCTNCGPRYTIVRDVPYDRPNTTMADFPMCPDCQNEYDNPLSRRFHAQPNACPTCGPQLFLRDNLGNNIAGDPLQNTLDRLNAGQILAIKGLGGYHLAVDAQNEAAVAELRRRKMRDEKPFALMARSVEQVEAFASVDSREKRFLESVERPIVLLKQRPDHPLSALVAPNNRYFGVMLPYTPLHYLLLEQNFLALVMTSANLSDEPIAYQDQEAITRLSDIADAYLTHNRNIFIRTDDSIARVMADRPLLLRRSRGYVPRSIFLPATQPPVLAVGAELKNTICLTQQDRAILSQHIGDLKNEETVASFVKTIEHLQTLMGVEPVVVAHDMHPDYQSSVYAESRTDITRIAVQHHHAHLASCLAEHGCEEPAIGVIFDGIGYGTDGRIWGGEFLIGDFQDFQRVGHLAYAAMPGGDAATKEPYRMALSYLFQAYGSNLPSIPLVTERSSQEIKLLQQMVERGINSPLTSSCGRLFDGVAALVGLRDRVSYEGQAALELEMAIQKDSATYPFPVDLANGLLFADWRPLIRSVVDDLQQNVDAGIISARFHNSLADLVREVCCRLRQTVQLEKVVLSGGVFQNCYLTERCITLLEQERFEVLTHSLVPPNDGGLALGQAVIAGRQKRKENNVSSLKSVQ